MNVNFLKYIHLRGAGAQPQLSSISWRNVKPRTVFSKSKAHFKINYSVFQYSLFLMLIIRRSFVEVSSGVLMTKSLGLGAADSPKQFGIVLNFHVFCFFFNFVKFAAPSNLSQHCIKYCHRFLDVLVLFKR